MWKYSWKAAVYCLHQILPTWNYEILYYNQTWLAHIYKTFDKYSWSLVRCNNITSEWIHSHSPKIGKKKKSFHVYKIQNLLHTDIHFQCTLSPRPFPRLHHLHTRSVLTSVLFIDIIITHVHRALESPETTHHDISHSRQLHTCTPIGNPPSATAPMSTRHNFYTNTRFTLVIYKFIMCWSHWTKRKEQGRSRRQLFTSGNYDTVPTGTCFLHLLFRFCFPHTASVEFLW